MENMLLIRIFLYAILNHITVAFYLRTTNGGRMMKVDPDVTTAPPVTEKCYYHLSNNGNGNNGGRTIFYGQCMSMMGPDGCCLEGHYQPGLCSNLGHLCCTKPDPDCQNMRNNKAITRSQAKKTFQQFVTNSRPPRSSSNGSPAPSSTITRRYQTNFEIIEMPAHMQLDPVSFVTYALDRYRGDFDEAADHLCTMLERKYPAEASPGGASWACYIGKDFGFSVDPEPGRYMLFKIDDDVGVMAFVPKTSTSSSSSTGTN